jgi:hypothetical protein
MEASRFSQASSSFWKPRPKDVTGYEVYADQLAAMLKGNRELLKDVLDGLFHIAKADCCAPE